MSELDQKKAQFSQRLEQLASQSKGAGSSLAPNMQTGLDGELNLRLQAWESLLEKRLEDYRRDSDEIEEQPDPPPEAAEVHPPPRPARERPFSHRDAALYTWLEDLEEMLLNDLELGRYPLPPSFAQPVQVVQSDQEMRQAIAEACNWPEPATLPLGGHSLGAFHIPGRGTLLNHAHYEREHGLRDLGQGAPEVCAHVVGEVAVERWGWGYLLEYSSLGKRAGEAGLWPALCARRLGLPFSDPVLAERAAALHQAWILVETGWLDWIWQYVMLKAHHPMGSNLFHRPRPGRVIELLNRIVDLFPLYLTPFGLRIRLRNLFDLVKFLFLEESEALPTSLNQLICAMQAFCVANDARIAERIQQALSKMLGQLYFSRLESKVGILATPYAVLIAAHVSGLDLEGEGGATQILEQISQDPYLNPDTRLALLANLDPRIKYDPKAMATAAWERLRLEGPNGYFA